MLIVASWTIFLVISKVLLLFLCRFRLYFCRWCCKTAARLKEDARDPKMLTMKWWTASCPVSSSSSLRLRSSRISNIFVFLQWFSLREKYFRCLLSRQSDVVEIWEVFQLSCLLNWVLNRESSWETFPIVSHSNWRQRKCWLCRLFDLSHSVAHGRDAVYCPVSRFWTKVCSVVCRLQSVGQIEELVFGKRQAHLGSTRRAAVVLWCVLSLLLHRELFVLLWSNCQSVEHCVGHNRQDSNFGFLCHCSIV